jgi:hypothetical protein
MPIIPMLAFVWAFPTTLLGLIMATLTLITGGTAKVVDGVLEASGGASTFYLRRVVGLFLPGGASAMTLGYVVIGRDAESLELTRPHERVHVRQCGRWGPFFVPAYFLASALALAMGRRPYRDNFFERQAFSESKCRSSKAS